jgi:hypothetical protein
MTDGYAVQPDQLGDTASQYAAVADDLKSIMDSLLARLHDNGNCWGNDESGKAFGDKYVPAAFSAVEAFRGTTQGMRSFYDGIMDWAKGYINVDELAKADASQIADTGA